MCVGEGGRGGAVAGASQRGRDAGAAQRREAASAPPHGVLAGRLGAGTRSGPVLAAHGTLAAGARTSASSPPPPPRRHSVSGMSTSEYMLQKNSREEAQWTASAPKVSRDCLRLLRGWRRRRRRGGTPQEEDAKHGRGALVLPGHRHGRKTPCSATQSPLIGGGVGVAATGVAAAYIYGIRSSSTAGARSGQSKAVLAVLRP